MRLLSILLVLLFASCEKYYIQDQSVFDNPEFDGLSPYNWPVGYCTSETAYYPEKVLLRQEVQWSFTQEEIFQDGCGIEGEWTDINRFQTESGAFTIRRTDIVYQEGQDTINVWLRRK